MITLPPATKRSAYGAPPCHAPRPKPDSRARITTCHPGTPYRLRLDHA